MALDYTDYDALPAEDKAILDQHTVALRSMMGAMLRMRNSQDAIKDVYDTSVSTILTGITTGQGVRNPSGLANADELTRDEHITLQSYINAFLVEFDDPAKLALMVKAAGLNSVN